MIEHYDLHEVLKTSLSKHDGFHNVRDGYWTDAGEDDEGFAYIKEIVVDTATRTYAVTIKDVTGRLEAYAR